VWAAETLGGRLVVAGDSSGGNVAAVAALLTRDRGGPPLRGQVLLYPVIDPDCDSPTYASHGTGYYLTAGAMRWYWHHYLGGRRPEPAHLVAPLRAPSLAGLPPAVVVLGRLDPLYGEGLAYARALGAAGVPVVLREYPDMFHGFATIGPFTAGASARAILWSDVRDMTREASDGC
jgi:acetyl esterase